MRNKISLNIFLLICILFFSCKKNEYKIPTITYEKGPKLSKKVISTDNSLDQITSMHFSPDGEYFITSAYSEGICVWKFKSMQLIRRIRIYSNCAAISPDGKFLACGFHYLSIFDIQTGKLIKKIGVNAKKKTGFEGLIIGIVFSRNGKYIKCKYAKSKYGYSNFVRYKRNTILFNIRNGNIIEKSKNKVFKNSKNLKFCSEVLYYQAESFYPERDIHVKWNYSFKSIKTDNIEVRKNGELIKKIKLPFNNKPQKYIILLHPNQKFALVYIEGEWPNRNIFLYDLNKGIVLKKLIKKTKKRLVYIKNRISPHFIKFDDLRNQFLIITLNNGIFLFNFLKGKIRLITNIFRKLDFANISPDSKYFSVNSFNQKTYKIQVKIFNMKTNKVIHEIFNLDSSFYCNFVRLNGKIYFVYVKNYKIHIIDLNKSAKLVKIFKVRCGYLFSIKVSNKFGFIIQTGTTSVDSGKGGIRIFDYKTGRLKKILFINEFYSNLSYSKYFINHSGSKIFGETAGKLFIYNFLKNKTKILKHDYYKFFDINQDFNKILLVQPDKKFEMNFKIFKLNTNKLIWSENFNFKRMPKFAVFGYKDRFILFEKHNYLVIKSIKTRQFIKLKIFKNGSMFIQDNKGNFDFTSGAKQFLYFVQGMRKYPFTVKKNKKYKPGLYQTFIKNNK